MLELELPREMQDRLDVLARKTGKTLDFHAQQAIAEYLEAEEDCSVAAARLRDGRLGIPLDEVERRFELAD